MSFFCFEQKGLESGVLSLLQRTWRHVFFLGIRTQGLAAPLFGIHGTQGKGPPAMFVRRFSEVESPGSPTSWPASPTSPGSPTSPKESGEKWSRGVEFDGKSRGLVWLRLLGGFWCLWPPGSNGKSTHNHTSLPAFETKRKKGRSGPSRRKRLGPGPRFFSSGRGVPEFLG